MHVAQLCLDTQAMALHGLQSDIFVHAHFRKLEYNVGCSRTPKVENKSRIQKNG
jgi:hypothetical protein